MDSTATKPDVFFSEFKTDPIRIENAAGKKDKLLKLKETKVIQELSDAALRRRNEGQPTISSPNELGIAIEKSKGEIAQEFRRLRGARQEEFTKQEAKKTELIAKAMELVSELVQENVLQELERAAEIENNDESFHELADQSATIIGELYSIGRSLKDPTLAEDLIKREMQILEDKQKENGLLLSSIELVLEKISKELKEHPQPNDESKTQMLESLEEVKTRLDNLQEIFTLDKSEGPVDPFLEKRIKTNRSSYERTMARLGQRLN